MVRWRNLYHADADPNTDTDSNANPNPNANANANADANAGSGQARPGRLLAQLYQSGRRDVPDQPGEQ